MPKTVSNLLGLLSTMVLAALILVTALIAKPNTVKAQSATTSIPLDTLLRIVKAEDERRWDDELRTLLKDRNPSVRSRAALASGRIGNEESVPALLAVVNADPESNVREMAIFALGEIESAEAVGPLRVLLTNANEAASVRARAIEALGKIAGSLPADQDKQKSEINETILAILKAQATRAGSDDQIILFGLTAALRSRPPNAGPAIAEFLESSNPRIRADAANALARLRLKDGSTKLLTLVVSDKDPIVRANAARALGAADNKEAFDVLLGRALSDSDLRVRVGAIRSLGALKDARAAEPLLKRGNSLSVSDLRKRPTEANELLEIATTLGRLMQTSDNREALVWLRKVREGFGYEAPELEIAAARISPSTYLEETDLEVTLYNKGSKGLANRWKVRASVAQGLEEINSATTSIQNRSAIIARAETALKALLRNNDSAVNSKANGPHPEYSIPEILRALAAFKPQDLGETLRTHLEYEDVIVRATAAELLGEFPPDPTNEKALAAAFPRALRDDLNDAALSILDSLAKQRTAGANETLKSALASSDYLIRRRAVSLLKTSGAGDFSSRIGTVSTRYTLLDYKRAVARAERNTRATVNTAKGSFVIEFLTEEAPLTVDNFVRLAQKRYFNGQVIPRVVPNFVVQAGDPRGDQNGGPGYSIRCEINETPFDRAVVGMALSGKDTGGSQWFVTHSPQPHLDGGYTVFGRVVSGMDVVDAIVRGDSINSVTIVERPPLKNEISTRRRPERH